jgi:polyisoprenoid-binding protein YceI
MSTTEIQTPEAVRVVDGRSVPAVGTWKVDVAHSNVEFVARHLTFTKIRGRVTDYDATITIADAPQDSSVNVTMQVASLSTGDEGRDGHLLSPDFFDAETYPVLTFASTTVTPVGDTTWKVDGDLTVRDATKPVVLDVEFGGIVTDPWGADKAIFSASAEINREDWGLTWNQPLANGGLLVGKKIKIELEIQAAQV